MYFFSAFFTRSKLYFCNKENFEHLNVLFISAVYRNFDVKFWRRFWHGKNLQDFNINMNLQTFDKYFLSHLEFVKDVTI